MAETQAPKTCSAPILVSGKFEKGCSEAAFEARFGGEHLRQIPRNLSRADAADKDHGQVFYGTGFRGGKCAAMERHGALT